MGSARWSTIVCFSQDPDKRMGGYTLIVTRRAVPDLFSATDDEKRAILQLVEEVKRQLDLERRPDGYNAHRPL